MPLFKKSTPPPPAPVIEERRGLFGQKKQVVVQPGAAAYDSRGNARRSVDDSRSGRSPTTHSSGGGLFGGSKHRSRSRSSSSERTRSRSTGGGGLFNRSADPSVAHAKQRIHDAEVAERQADQALMASRAAVQQAREQAKLVEREAAEE
jgi:hypothetical protein